MQPGQLAAPDVPARCLEYLGQAYCRRGDLASASRTFAEALELCRNAGDDGNQAVLCGVRRNWRCSGESGPGPGWPARPSGSRGSSGLRTQEGEARRVHGLKGRSRKPAAARAAFSRGAGALAGADEVTNWREPAGHTAVLLEQGDMRTAADCCGTRPRSSAAGDCGAPRRPIQLLFRLETGNDRDAALLQAISSLSALAWRPARFVKQCLLRCARD